MRITVVALSLCVLLAFAPSSYAQQDPMAPPTGLPPQPNPPKEKPENTQSIKDELGRYNPDNDSPWELPESMLKAMEESAEAYKAIATKLTSDETARSAEYGDDGQAKKEKIRRYAYLLEPSAKAGKVIEIRNPLTRDGSPKSEVVKDEEPFPPAYAWVFLFSKENQPFFDYRLIRDGFEGFDWVKEIQFRGALAFSDGKDIREWEGTVIVDATSWTPLEIFAQPSNQTEKILAQYRNWSDSFNVLNFRTGPKPYVYRSHAKFHNRKSNLTFPTALRYDTLRAVSPEEMVRVKTSTRTYGNYRFFKVEPKEPEFSTTPTDPEG